MTEQEKHERDARLAKTATKVWKREAVEHAAQEAGFVVEYTGGDCRAYGWHRPDGWYLWLTRDDGVNLPKSLDEADCLWGVYGSETHDSNLAHGQWIAVGHGTARDIIEQRVALVALAKHRHETEGLREGKLTTLAAFLA